MKVSLQLHAKLIAADFVTAEGNIRCSLMYDALRKLGCG